MNRIAVVAAGTILLLTGMLATMADAQEEERCKNNETTAAGASTYLGKGRARRLAITAWQREVRAKYGERYMDFRKAKNGRFECEAAGIGVVGQFNQRCIVRATPCRLVAAVDDDTIGEGDDDRRVFRIQRLLSRAGYLGEDDVDGEYGPRTREAVRRFQRDEGLRVTGEADDSTLERLRQRGAPTKS